MPLMVLLLILLVLLLSVAVITLHYRNQAFALGFCAALAIFGIPYLLTTLLTNSADNAVRDTEHGIAPMPATPSTPSGPTHPLLGAQAKYLAASRII